MRTILLLAACVMLGSALRAAEPVVTLRNLGSLYLDGACSGALEDTLANYPAAAPAIKAAVIAYIERACAAEDRDFCLAIIARAESAGVTVPAETKAKVPPAPESASGS